MSHAYDVDSDDESCGEKIEIPGKDLQDLDTAIFKLQFSPLVRTLRMTRFITSSLLVFTKAKSLAASSLVS